MSLRFRVALGILTASLAASALAEGPDPSAPGQARSQSFAPFAPDGGVAVRPWDNSDANLMLQRRFAEALAKRNVRVQDMPAPVVLNFETEVDDAIRRGAPPLGETRAESGDADERATVFSTTRDGMLGGRAEDARGVLRYTLIATLDDERTGRRLWQGEASYTGAPADESAALAAMIPILVEQIGRTVRERSFRLE